MRARTSIAGIVVFAAAAAISGFFASRTDFVASKGAAFTVDSAEADSTEFRHHSQLLLVYVGRASCRWCTSPEMHTALDSIRSLLHALADRRGMSFRVHAMGVDTDPRMSLQHLKKMGSFDAVSAGDGWLSLSAGRLAWGNLAGPRATPQLILLARKMRMSGTLTAGFAEVLHERVVTRKIGLFEIQDWLSQGASVGPITMDLAARFDE